MTIPNRPIASTDIVDELDYPPPLTLRDEEVMSLADVTDTVTQLDTEGKSAVSGEVRVTTGPMVNLNVYEFFDRPTVPGDYILIVEHEVSSSGAGTPALQSGTLPTGSRLTLIVKEYIRGAGANAPASGNGLVGGTAVHTTVPTTIDVVSGYVWGGGGSGGSVGGTLGGGGGGAGKVAGRGNRGANGTLTAGGKGDVIGVIIGGNGGGPGLPGTGGKSASSSSRGGAAGPSIRSNGHPVTWIGDTADNVRGPRS